MQTITGGLPWAAPRRRKEGEARPWLAIHDSSGDFIGRRFRQVDITTQWPEGTIFWNTEHGDVCIWQFGRCQALAPGRAENRANRIGDGIG